MERIIIQTYEKLLTSWESLRYLAYTVFILLDININVMNIVIYLICADMILGGIKAFRIPSLTFSFKEFYKGLISKLILLLVPMVVALLYQMSGNNINWLVNGIIKVVIISESISILSNLSSIKNKVELSSKDLIHLFISKSLNLIKRGINGLIKRI